ncbi:hypothetical protein AMJ51_00805 [Microgenomates bacterium DG_75]|nr:MAG: hypothetical protein AMJ51_00805 [Microgenomates bacterium DG_75]
MGIKEVISPANQDEETLADQKYPLHRNIVATVFWVGEEATEENDYITNRESIWDTHWLESYGGVDNPDQRDGWYPQGFIPKENPFYLALPYSDFEEKQQKGNLNFVPWYHEPVADNVSLVKNRWVKIFHQDKVCFGQWEDAGPILTDDVDYVFGTARPRNTFGLKAGIDVSPALRDCLEIGTSARVDWQFVDEEDVPSGPWKQIITRSDPNF